MDWLCANATSHVTKSLIAEAYCNLKRVIPPLIDFETGFPKTNIAPPKVIDAFTIVKNV